MEIEIRWRWIRSFESPRWDASGCLFAYLCDNEDLVYIGKCWGKTIWQRYRALDKSDLARWMEAEFGHSTPDVLHGEIWADEEVRLTRELLADLEFLLVHSEKPPGNVSGSRVRNTRRPGMAVLCSGRQWPGRRRQVGG